MKDKLFSPVWSMAVALLCLLAGALSLFGDGDIGFWTASPIDSTAGKVLWTRHLPHP